jgi:hypothetical protein
LLTFITLQRVETNPWVAIPALEAFQNWKLLIVDSPPKFLLENSDGELNLAIKPLFGMAKDESVIAMTIPEIRTVKIIIHKLNFLDFNSC